MLKISSKDPDQTVEMPFQALQFEVFPLLCLLYVCLTVYVAQHLLNTSIINCCVTISHFGRIYISVSDIALLL